MLKSRRRALARAARVYHDGARAQCEHEGGAERQRDVEERFRHKGGAPREDWICVGRVDQWGRELRCDAREGPADGESVGRVDGRLPKVRPPNRWFSSTFAVWNACLET